MVRRLAVLALVAVSLTSLAACASTPEAKKKRALERAAQYEKDGKLNEAILELRTALTIDQDFVPALQALARAYSAKAWYADAARELTRARKLDPQSIPIQADLGRALVDAGAFVDAEVQ